MWHVNPGMLAPSYGSWYFIRDISYIGIKSHSGKCGWIEVDALDPYRPKILKYAIQK